MKYSWFTVLHVPCGFYVNTDTSMQNDNRFTPLIGACMTGQVDIAKLLLEHKATVDYQNEVICSMGEAAVGLLEIVLSCYLLWGGVSALIAASTYGHTAIVILLLDYGAQVDLFDEVRAYQSELY